MRKNSNQVEIDFDELILIFNNNGKKAASEYVESTYGVSYTQVQRRISKETSYIFNRSSRKYEKEEKNVSPFMTMAELCKEEIPTETQETSKETIEMAREDNSFKDIIVDLMKDRMIEIGKYIHMQQSSKQIMINIKLLKHNGYEVMLN
jgi:hypothetical protein